MVTILVLVLALMTGATECAHAEPMGTAFTYQGFLLKNKNPANDVYDFEFELYDSPSDGNQVAGPLAVNDVNVEDGHITVELDFAGNVFDGNALWVQTTVRDGGSTDPCDFVTLSPRKELTPAPYALYAAKAAAIAPGGAAGMQHAIVRGFELTYNSSGDLYVEPGTLFHGHTAINKTTRTNLLMAMPTHWWNGTVHSYASEGWSYIGVNSSGDIRFLADNPPNAADTEGHTEGTKLFWLDNALTYWRVIGAIRVNTSNEVAGKWSQQGNMVMWDAPISLATTVKDTAWSGAISCASGMPAISTVGIFGTYANAASVGGMSIRPNGGTWNIPHGQAAGVSAHSGSGGDTSEGQIIQFTDPSQRIQYTNVRGSGTYAMLLTIWGYYLNIR